MSKSYSKCQYIDTLTTLECENWYEAEDGQSLCPEHREILAVRKEAIHIPRTVTVMGDDHINKLNEEVSRCLEMSIPDLALHIQGIEERIKELERDRRAANIAKRNLEDRLTEEEREALRSDTSRYKSGRDSERAPRKSPKSREEKAKSRKEGFSAWAARLGVKTEELMVMDDDEMAARIAKYKASKG